MVMLRQIAHALPQYRGRVCHQPTRAAALLQVRGLIEDNSRLADSLAAAEVTRNAASMQVVALQQYIDDKAAAAIEQASREGIAAFQRNRSRQPLTAAGHQGGACAY